MMHARSRSLLAGALAWGLCCGALLAGAPGGGCASNKKALTPPSATPEEYRKAVEAAMKGDTLRKQKKWAQAADAYREAITYKDDVGPFWLNAGVCLIELGDYLPARDAFLRAVDLMPSDPRPYENLGVLYHNRGYDDKALEYYVESLKLDPNYLPSLRGAVYSGKNIREVSFGALERVNRAILAEHDPDYLKMMQAERFRITGALKEQEKAGA